MKHLLKCWHTAEHVIIIITWIGLLFTYWICTISQRNILSFISISWKNSMLYLKTKRRLLLIAFQQTWLWRKVYSFQGKNFERKILVLGKPLQLSKEAEKFDGIWKCRFWEIRILFICPSQKYFNPLGRRILIIPKVFFFQKERILYFLIAIERAVQTGKLWLRNKGFTGFYSIFDNFDLFYTRVNREIRKRRSDNKTEDYKTVEKWTMAVHLWARAHAAFK